MKKQVLIFFCCIFCLGSCARYPNTSAVSSLSQREFDSDTCCWRKLSREGKHREAAQLLTDYVKNSPQVTNKHALNWHAGQMWAMAGQAKQAKKAFRKTYWVGYRWFGGEDGRAWYYYAKGTVAFLDHDKAALEKAIRKWPPRDSLDINYKALLLLKQNWGKSYAEAWQ